jgi:hypothetical protein
MRRLLALPVILLLAASCGGPAPDLTGEAESALNGHSIVPPGGGWTSFTQPWLCDVPIGWNPMISTWPAHGHCQWMPSATSGPDWNVQKCIGDPTTPGTADIYSFSGNAGSCARIAGLGGTTPFQWDSDLVQVNGWLSIWINSGGFPKQTSINSIKVAPHTEVILCEGPFTGPANNPCNAYNAFQVDTGPVVISYPSLPIYQPAAIQIKALQ